MPHVLSPSAIYNSGRAFLCSFSLSSLAKCRSASIFELKLWYVSEVGNSDETFINLGNGNIVHLQLDKRYLAFQRLENGHCRKYSQHLGCINKLTFEHIKYFVIHFYITITIGLVQLN